jgi:hypothetical protein
MVMETKTTFSAAAASENTRNDSTEQPPDLEALGRQRPVVFKTMLSEIGFCFSLLASMFMAVRNVIINASQEGLANTGMC